MLGLDMGAKRVGCAKFGLFTKYCQVSPHLQQAYSRRVTFGAQFEYTTQRRSVTQARKGTLNTIVLRSW